MATPNLTLALRALNEAAYAAEKAARHAQDPCAEALRVIMWQTDGLVDRRPVEGGAA